MTVKAFNGDSEVAMNQTVFFVGQPTEQILWNQSRGEPMPVILDKGDYSPSDTVRLSVAAPAKATRASATFDNGTRFYVDLPVTIPLINLRRIYDSQSWFIFSALIVGLLMTPVITRLEQMLPGSKDNKDEQAKKMEAKKE